MRKIDISDFIEVDGVRLFIDKDYPGEASIGEVLAKLVDLVVEYEEAHGIDTSYAKVRTDENGKIIL